MDVFSVSRRSFFKKSAALGAAWMGLSQGRLFGAQAATAVEPFELAPLPYAFGALEPVIASEIMQLHYGKHHAGYVRKLNAALARADFEADSLAALLRYQLPEIPVAQRAAVRQNGGGMLNHALFWDVMSPEGGGEPQGSLSKAIRGQFGSFEAFKDGFSKMSGSVFGSGWGWLSVRSDGALFLSKTANQDSPLMEGFVQQPGIPILGLDVWEHAYYLQYKNRRGDYIAEWWKVVNWPVVQARYEAALDGVMLVDSVQTTS